MTTRHRGIVLEWAAMAAALLLFSALVACASPPVVEVQTPGRGAAPLTTLVLGEWRVVAVGDTWAVLPGTLRHEVKGEPPPPTVAVAAPGGTGAPGGWSWQWGWIVAALVAAGAAWWVFRPIPGKRVSG